MRFLVNKSPLSQKRCERELKLLLITYKKLFRRLRLASSAITLDDLKHQNRGFIDCSCDFNLQYTFQEWMAPKGLKIDQNNRTQKFSAFNVNFNSQSLEPLGSSRPAHEGVKKAYPLKSRYFITVGSFSVQTVADRHRFTAYCNKNC